MKKQIDELKKELAKQEKLVMATREKIAKIEKANKPADPLDITSYPMVCKSLKIQNKVDIVSLSGLSSDDVEVVNAIIKKMRICKVLNSGHRFKRGDNRWYSWYNVSSGFVFDLTLCDHSTAGTSSASRLCFLDAKTANHFVKHFKDIDESIIDL